MTQLHGLHMYLPPVFVYTSQVHAFFRLLRLLLWPMGLTTFQRIISYEDHTAVVLTCVVLRSRANLFAVCMNR